MSQSKVEVDEGAPTRRGGSGSRGRGDMENMDQVPSREPSATTKSVRRQQSDPSNAPPRLLVISSKIRNSSVMSAALLSNITFLQYKYESTSLDTLLGAIAQQLGGKKVESVCFILSGNTNSINITGKDDKSLTKESITDSCGLREFFTNIVGNHLDRSLPGRRIDFLACQLAQQNGGETVAICKEMENLIKLPVGIAKDIAGSDITLERKSEEDSRPRCVGELYFRMERLRNWSATHQQTLAGFEKIRTVGKGAYGTAVLYRKKDDDSLVILKEVNLHDLNAAERQLALNEVKVLAMLDHPNIISYYDSFEEDGLVMIEMEYADGGTLAQHLSAQASPLEEREILGLFQQMVAAIKYMHGHNILHRDLKTANIFLTKEGIVKVGDFGISKLMSTANQRANTVLGTPYYISPEMCEGKPYNDRSDIWALGCILYEMACLQRTFEGSNLPALVNKIMKGQFAPVKGNYSSECKEVIMAMLQRDADNRPSAEELWTKLLPELMAKYAEPMTDYEEDASSTDGAAGKHGGNKKRSSPNVLEKRSVLYYFETSNMALHPIVLPSKVKIRDVAVGNDHVIAVTVERMVYSWGSGSKGQLGHGTLDDKPKPELVDALKGKSIIKAGCGDGFSIFLSDNGIVMTCGDGTHGALGHGDYCSTTRPRLIEALLSVDVVSLACGSHHIVAVGSDGEVFTWGKGADGRLGLGNEDNHCLPQEVAFSEEAVCVRECRCGHDGTMLLTDVGSVLACGNNEYNKLGLNQRQGFLMAMKNIFNKTEVPCESVFRVVRALTKHRVLDVSMGPQHTAVVVEPGHVYTMGRNTDGQLGTGSTKPPAATPTHVRALLDFSHAAQRVQCARYFTVASTMDNDLVFWGTRFKTPPPLPIPATPSEGTGDTPVASPTTTTGPPAPPSRQHSRAPSTASVASVNSGGAGAGGKDDGGAGNNTGDGSTPIRTPSASSNSRGGGGVAERENRRDDDEVILQPTPLLRMDSSGSRSQAGDTVTLSKFFCHGENLFIQVETTAPPPPKRKARRKKFLRKRLSGTVVGTAGGAGAIGGGGAVTQASPNDINGGTFRMSASSRDGGDEYSSEASELDTRGSIPAWLREELAASAPVTDGNEADDTSGDEEESSSHTPTLESSMSSIQINRDFKQAPVASSSISKKSLARPTVPINVGGRGGGVGGSSSMESGVEVGGTEDRLSSSSCSEGALHTVASAHAPSGSNMKGDKVRKGAGAASATGGVTTSAAASGGSKRLMGPPAAPHKSKAGPQHAQKPLTRLRAQGKMRRSDPNAAATNPESSTELSKQHKESIDHLSVELEAMRAEKQKTEARLRQMEQEQREQQEQIRRETERRAVEREHMLKRQIDVLKSELGEQNNMLHDNYNVVLSLQQQLVKIQTEQLRYQQQHSDSGGSSRPQSRHSTQSQPQRESKICVLQ